MTDEESSVDPKAHATPNTYGETLLYDFAKFMTTLALLILGAVLTLTKDTLTGAAQPVKTGLVITAISVAGVLSLTVVGNLAQARSTGVAPSPNLQRAITAALALLGIGTGAFLQIWWTSLR